MSVNTRKASNRIVATVNSATPAQIARGLNWYADAQAVALELVALGAPSIDHAAHVIAALSPRTKWARNVSAAVSLVTVNEAPGALGSNIDRARRVLAASDPRDAFTKRSPKIRAFAANILGDDDAVTVDVWAARVALGANVDADKALRPSGAYESVAHAYRLAARRLGVTPREAQAIAWVVVTESAPPKRRRRGADGRLSH